MSDDEGQPMLSKFGAGDTDNVDLALPEDGFDLDAKREVEAYAEDITRGGWEVVNVSNDRVSWWNPDGTETYWLERKKAGWHGKRGGRDVTPNYTEDLQEAIDGAGEFLENHPIDEDEEEDELRSDGGRSSLEVLYDADIFECVHLPAIDVTVTVVDRLSMFGNAGIVGADPDGVAYLLLEDHAESTPPIRVERWNGNTYDPVMRASRIENRGEGPDGMFVIPNSASSEAEQIAREAARRARTDGGTTPATELRRVTRGDQVTIAVDSEEIHGRVTGVDDAPEPAVDIFEDPLKVRISSESDLYKLTTYRTMNMNDTVHIDRDRSSGDEETWEQVGAVERLEIGPKVRTDGSGKPEDVLLRVEEGDRLRVEIGGMGVQHLDDVHREAELVLENVDGPKPDDDPLSPFVESMSSRGHRTEGISDGEIEGWVLSMSKRSDGSWMGPRIVGFYYGSEPGSDDGVLDYRDTAPVTVDAIEVIDE